MIGSNFPNAFGGKLHSLDGNSTITYNRNLVENIYFFFPNLSQVCGVELVIYLLPTESKLLPDLKSWILNMFVI